MDKPTWLKVSISVDGELAEAVAEVFSRIITSGVVIENTNFEDTGISVKDELTVFGFLPVNDKTEAARQQLEESIWHLGMIQPLPNLTYENIQEKNWMEAWKEHFHPIRIGEQIIVLPAWIDPREYSDLHTIIIDPGMAFGTGSHPTTQLSLELLEIWIEAGQDIIDVGCGSGILSIGAVKLGASRVLAVDVDNVAVEYARDCMNANGVAENVEIGQGSVDTILSGEFDLLQADVVIANIIAKILLKLFMEGIDKLIGENGKLILSGILKDQEEKILSSIKDAGLVVIDKRSSGDWLALVCQRLPASNT